MIGARKKRSDFSEEEEKDGGNKGYYEAERHEAKKGSHLFRLHRVVLNERSGQWRSW